MIIAFQDFGQNSESELSDINASSDIKTVRLFDILSITAYNSSMTSQNENIGFTHVCEGQSNISGILVINGC